jgi:hypothetical protein
MLFPNQEKGLQNITVRDTLLRIRIEGYKCSEYDSSSNEGTQ